MIGDKRGERAVEGLLEARVEARAALGSAYDAVVGEGMARIRAAAERTGETRWRIGCAALEEMRVARLPREAVVCLLAVLCELAEEDA